MIEGVAEIQAYHVGSGVRVVIRRRSSPPLEFRTLAASTAGRTEAFVDGTSRYMLVIVGAARADVGPKARQLIQTVIDRLCRN